MFDLTNAIYNDADKAREHLEAIHWPNGPVCPTCGNCDPERITKLMGKSTRPGVYKCKECRLPFTVTVGTVFERSKIALNKWVLAAHLMASSKKGMSAHQLHRMLGVTYKTAWFMAHRIREAMKEDHASNGPMGGEGKVVEVDETYIGKRETPAVLSRGRIAKPTKSGKAGGAQKRVVVGLVERGGKVRTFHINHATKETVKEVLDANVSKDTNLYTDESRLYKTTGKEFADHQTTKLLVSTRN
jgi:transposase-like protein